MIYKVVTPNMTGRQLLDACTDWQDKSGYKVGFSSAGAMPVEHIHIKTQDEEFVLCYTGSNKDETIQVVQEGQESSALTLKRPVVFFGGNIDEVELVQDFCRHLLDTFGGFWADKAEPPKFEGEFYQHIKGSGWGANGKELQIPMPAVSWQEIFQKLGGPVRITNWTEYWDVVTKIQTGAAERTSAFQ